MSKSKPPHASSVQIKPAVSRTFSPKTSRKVQFGFNAIFNCINAPEDVEETSAASQTLRKIVRNSSEWTLLDTRATHEAHHFFEELVRPHR